jgi:asparagine synthase (glutamine-hydrolysing)
MSGQAGVWNFDGKPADKELLQKFSAAISQHAPDGEHIHLIGSLGMLYRPSHTTQESRREHQPHVCPRGVVIAWDGRLDNREDLIRELKGNLISPQTDVAIVAATFDRWGTDCFRKLIGDWALSIWDPVERRLVLARDYMGIRHLYYYLTATRVVWCTYLNPLAVLSGAPFTVNDDYIAGYLVSLPSAHLTPYREIQAIPPGRFVTIRDGAARDRGYWSLGPRERILYKSDTEYEEHFRYLFRQAVRRRLRSDSPVVAELSGGIDSSSIVCMADDIIAKGEAETPLLDTISRFDPREPTADERRFIAKIEEKRGRKGHHVDIAKHGDDHFCFGSHELLTVPGPSQHLEGTRANIHSLLQRHGYRVLLSGTGGDEFLGSLPNPQSQLADLIVLPQPVELARQLAAWSASKKRHWTQLLFDTLIFLLPTAIRAHFSKPARIEPWINAWFANRYRLRIRWRGPQGTYGFWRPSRQEYARNIVAMRRRLAFTQPHSLVFEERRYPYLDLNLLEFLASVPFSQLLRPGQRRSLMRRALVGLVPNEILWRKTKGGSSPSLLLSFQENWPQLEKLFVSSLSARMGYVNQARFFDLLQTAKRGDLESVIHLARGLYLESWLRGLTEHGVIASPPETLADHLQIQLPQAARRCLKRESSS